MEYYRWYLDERMTSGKQEGMLYTSYAMDNMIKAFDHINRATGVRELADAGDPRLSGLCGRSRQRLHVEARAQHRPRRREGAEREGRRNVDERLACPRLRLY